MQLPSRERVLSLLTDDEIKTAIENAAYCAGEFVRRADIAIFLSEARFKANGGDFFAGADD
jgi:hypothetical protein